MKLSVNKRGLLAPLMLIVLIIFSSNFAARAHNGIETGDLTSTEAEQKPIYRNVFGEFFGPSGFFGVNYDSRFKRGSKWGYRVGVGYSPFEIDALALWDDLLTIPLAVNGLFGKNNNFFEVGFGLCPEIKFRDHKFNRSDFFWKVFIDLGYRYQQRNGFFLRVGITPLLEGDGPFGILRVPPYLGVGYTFK